MRSFSFILGNKEYKKNLELSHLNQLSQNVGNALFSTGQYQIQSNVNFQNLKSFLDFFVDKTQSPVINSENIYDFRQLSFELNILTDYFQSKEFDSIYKISALKNAKEKSDKFLYEDYISQNLDFFIDNYPNDLSELSICSLYNIFYRSNRKLNNHKNAYKFITSHEKNNKQIFILLSSLDDSKLDDKIIDESISKRDERFGFSPQLSVLSYKEKQMTIQMQTNGLNRFQSVIESQKQKLSEKDKEIESQKQKLSEKDKEIESQKIELEKMIQSQKKRLSEKDKVIDSLKQKLSEKDKSAESQKQKMGDKIKVIESQKVELEKIVQSQKHKMMELEKIIQSQKNELGKKDMLIKDFGCKRIVKGSLVRVKKNACIYAQNDSHFSSWVYANEKPFIVKEICGERAVIFNGDTCIGAIHVNDLILV